MEQAFRSVRLVIAGLGFVVCSPGMAQSSLSSLMDTASTAPVYLRNLSRAILDRYEYRDDVGRNWTGVTDQRGKTLGNCTVFARLVHTSLSELGYLPRYVNVDLISPVTDQDPRHVVTVVTDRRGIEWVFDNRFSDPYRASHLTRHYHKPLVSRMSGTQKAAWRSTRITNYGENRR